jgi:hypothetical protein
MRTKILRFFYYINIALHLHSKAPTEEIKRIWEIIGLGGTPILILTIFSGVKIIWFIPSFKIDFINDYGGFIFFTYVIILMVIFFDNKKCKEITKEQSKHGKP